MHIVCWILKYVKSDGTAHWKVHSCTHCTGHGNDFWVDSNGTDGKPTFRRHANLSSLSKICNHFREIAAWSRKSLMIITYLLRFLEKKTSGYGQIFTNLFRKNSPRLRTTSCVQISWNLADRKSTKSCVIYLTRKKNKISASSPALASVRIAPKICQVQLQTIYSEFPEFHPNPFTSGRVIAERVNIVQTRHKVFPILGEASSPSSFAE